MQPAYWTSEDIKPEEQKRLEQKWRRTQFKVNYDAFKRQRNRVNAVLNTLRIKYFTESFKEKIKTMREHLDDPQLVNDKVPI